MTDPLFIVLCLLAGHYFADYSHLSTDRMLHAKAKGWPLFPILRHAAVHALFCGTILAVFYDAPKALWGALIQLISHFCIDTFKGRLTQSYPTLQKPTTRPYWYALGFDQYLHQLVLILTVLFLEQY